MRDLSSLVRTKEELELIRKSGDISAHALKTALRVAKPGVSLLEIEKVATEKIAELGGQSAFKTVPGYNWTTCLALNKEVVHSIPRDIVLKEGDLLSIDLGTVFKGWYTDCAWSTLIGDLEDKEAERFLAAGEQSMWAGIKQAVGGQRIGDISEAMQKAIEDAGFNTVKSLSGHGVGRSYHEDPEVPLFGKAGTGPLIYPGMTLAIESIYTDGTGEVYQSSDGWTILASNGKWGGMFEMSVIVGQNLAEVLTDWRKV